MTSLRQPTDAEILASVFKKEEGGLDIVSAIYATVFELGVTTQRVKDVILHNDTEWV